MKCSRLERRWNQCRGGNKGIKKTEQDVREKGKQWEKAKGREWRNRGERRADLRNNGYNYTLVSLQ